MSFQGPSGDARSMLEGAEKYFQDLIGEIESKARDIRSEMNVLFGRIGELERELLRLEGELRAIKRVRAELEVSVDTTRKIEESA